MPGYSCHAGLRPLGPWPPGTARRGCRASPHPARFDDRLASQALVGGLFLCAFILLSERGVRLREMTMDVERCVEGGRCVEAFDGGGDLASLEECQTQIQV